MSGEDESADTFGDETVETVVAAGPSGLAQVDPDLAPGLYLVSTPIGNLRDISLRALDVLASVDAICAEDTRTTRKLLSAFSISGKMRPYHDHNGAKARPAILADLERGARIALVSDAGTPLVSDPGYKLVREALDAGHRVIPIPGASAVLAALAVAGLPTDRFLFAGFLPPKSGARRTALAELATSPATLVFYEGPSRLADCLRDMAEVLGDRECAIARELTKTFEEVRRGRLAELAAHYAGADPPRGEIVVLTGPPPEQPPAGEAAIDAAILEADPRLSIKEVAEAVAGRFGLARRSVYQRALELRDRDAE